MTNNNKKYNLKDSKDREELVKYAFDIEEDELLSLRDEMFKKGYRQHVDTRDVVLYYWLGEDSFDKYLHGMFEYDLAESEFLNVPMNHPFYQKVMEKNKYYVQNCLIDFLPEIVTGGKIKSVEFFDRSRLKSQIMKKWQSPEYQQVKSKLEEMLNGKS